MQNEGGALCITPKAELLLVDAEVNNHDEDIDEKSTLPHPSEIEHVAASAAARFAQSKLVLVLGIFLVGINLRPALSSLAPILEMVRQGTGLSSAGAGVLTTLPVLCFGIFAPLAPLLARWWSAERVILSALLVLAAGMALRVFLGVQGLFAGTLLVGASIGVVMVLLPGIIKRDFPRHAGVMTGLYTMALSLGAALASGITVPIKQLAGGDWRVALAFWMLPALLAAVIWWPQLAPRLSLSGGHQGQHRYRVSGVLRSKLAWQVTLYLGLQSALAYIVFGWLPTIMISRGMTPLDAGLLMSLSVSSQLITAFSGPWLATRGKDQRLMIILAVIFTTTGMMGCLFGGLGGSVASVFASGDISDIGAVWWWAVILGLGQGGTFSIALMLIVLRSSDPHIAASLSGMAQGFGYSIAALGPLAVGIMHDISDGWHTSAILFIVVAFGILVAGWGAGQNGHVKVTVTRE
ncbi:cyanate transporter [Glaciimonas sp. PCH181]|nr:cyanate transporter [Glaciimonas sp. PCH181]